MDNYRIDGTQRDHSPKMRQRPKNKPKPAKHAGMHRRSSKRRTFG